MRRSFSLAIAVGLVLCVTGAGPVLAQTQTGNINGTVKDPNGGALPGVTVVVSGASVMGVRNAVTGGSGGFRVVSLLPGDDYVVELTLDGFQGRRYEGIVVQVGQTITLSVTLELAAMTGEVTVSGESPIVDVTSPVASTHFGTDLLENIPNRGRGWEDAVVQAPGIADGSEPAQGRMFSARGGSVVNNQSAFDGVTNTTPTYNTQGSGIVFEAVDEVQVVNGALPAELGNVAGTYINMVTKSGGNQFRGEASIYFKDGDLQSDNVDGDQEAAGIETSKITGYDDWSFNLGGPIVRDRLWFNVATGVKNTAQTVSGFPEDDALDNDFYFGKLTWQPSPRHSLVGMYNRHDSVLAYWSAFGPIRFTEPEATLRVVLDYEIMKLKWTGILSDNVFLEVDLGRVENPNQRLDPQEGASHSYNDLATQIWSGGAPTYQDNSNGRDLAKAALSLFKDEWAGSHQLKVGVEYEKSFFDWFNYAISPVYFHYTFYGFPALALFGNQGDGVATPTEFEGRHAYAQDTWRVSERVTLSLGVRFNNWKGIYPAQSNAGYSYGPNVNFPPVTVGEDITAIDWSTWEPRLGAAIALDDQGKSALRIGLSRYHHGLNISYFVIGNPNSLALSVHPWVDLDGDVFADPDEVLPPVSFMGGVGNPIDPGLRQPYTDEVTLGFEKELFTDFSLTVNATWRQDNDLIDDMNVSVTEDSFLPTDIPDPGPDSILGTGDDRVLTVFNQIADFENLQAITNPDLAEREYRGVEVIATKRLSNGWQALASVVWQESTGTVGTDLASARGWSTAFNDPNSLINLDGPLSLDREWQVKLIGTYIAPLGFSFSGYWQYQTGVPLYRTYSVTLFQGPQDVVADPRDSHREDSLSQLDLRAEKVFSFGARPVELGLILDLFNVFNENAVTSRQPSTGSYNIIDGSYVPSPGLFGGPLTVQQPRTLRLGARVRF